MSTFIIRTFGCKTNQYEGQGMRESLLAAGFTEVDDPASADFCLINTCSVTHRADAGCRNAASSFRRSNPDGKVVVTGCAVDLANCGRAQIEYGDICIPNGEKYLIASILQESSYSCGHNEDRFAFSINGFAAHTRAFIKIHDGCDNFCAYCTIPYARGKPVSRPFAPIIDEARKLIDSGYIELVITGINFGAYCGENGENAADVVRAIGSLPGLARLRLSSLEPIYVTKELLDAIAETPVVCPHLHLPLQSGDDKVLKDMRRKYTVDEYMEIVGLVKSKLDRPALTTDVIVGFPGETAQEFENTCDTCRAVGFSRMHVFPFSPRAGTPAADMALGCTNREITERRKTLSGLAEKMAAEYAEQFVGSRVRIIPEQEKDGIAVGYSDRYLRTSYRGAKPDSPEVVEVCVDSSDGACLHGRLA